MRLQDGWHYQSNIRMNRIARQVETNVGKYGEYQQLREAADVVNSWENSWDFLRPPDIKKQIRQ